MQVLSELYLVLTQEIIAQVNHFSPKLSTLILQTALANKPSILQICQYSKFEISLLTDWKVMVQKLTFCWLKINFLTITFQPVDRLISNFECGKICRIDGLFTKAVCKNKVVNLGEKWLSWVKMSSRFHSKHDKIFLYKEEGTVHLVWRRLITYLLSLIQAYFFDISKITQGFLSQNNSRFWKQLKHFGGNN